MAVVTNPTKTGVPTNEVYSSFAAFPASGVLGTIYVDTSSSDIYLWTGAIYEQQTGGGGGNDPRVRIFRSTADQSGAVGVNQTIAELSCTLTASKHYYIECFIRFNTAAAAVWVINHKPTYTGTITALYATVGGATVSNQNILSQPPTSAFQLGTSVGANNTDFSPGHCMLSLSTGGSDTTFTYAFTANGNVTVAKSGSFIRVTELS